MTELEERLMESLAQLQEQYEQQFADVAQAMSSLSNELSELRSPENTQGHRLSASSQAQAWNNLLEERQKNLVQKSKTICGLCSHAFFGQSLDKDSYSINYFKCLITHESELMKRCSKFELNDVFLEESDPGIEEQPLIRTFGENYAVPRKKYVDDHC